MKKLMAVLALLMMSACDDPSIPDPRIRYDPPPPVLVKPAEKLKPIPTETPSENSNQNDN